MKPLTTAQKRVLCQFGRTGNATGFMFASVQKTWRGTVKALTSMGLIEQSSENWWRLTEAGSRRMTETDDPI